MGGVTSTQLHNSLRGDYGTYTISKEDETTVRWTEKGDAKESWTLKFAPGESIGGGQLDLGFGLLWSHSYLEVQPDCPKYAAGYTKCIITMQWDIPGLSPTASPTEVFTVNPSPLEGVEKPVKILDLRLSKTLEYIPPQEIETRVGVMEALSVVFMMDKELQNSLDEFILRLSGLIRSRYALSTEIWSLAEAMHRKQQKLDGDEEISDSVAVAAGIIAFLGLVLAPVSGGLSEAVALAADGAALVQAGSEIASTYISIENDQVAKDLVAQAQSKHDENQKEFDKINKLWKSFEALLEKKHSEMVESITQKTGKAYNGPTLEHFRTLVTFGRTLRQHDPKFGDIPTKEISNFEVEENIDAQDVWKHIKLALGLKHLHRIAIVANAVNLITGKSKNVVNKIRNLWSPPPPPGPAPPSEVEMVIRRGARREAWADEARSEELDELLPRGVEQAAEDGSDGARAAEAVEEARRWRYAWDYEAENPGMLLKLAKWSYKTCRGVEMSANLAKTLAKTKFTFGVAFTALGTAMDAWSLADVIKRIDNNSWSESATDLKKQHVALEAQVNELLKFRASLDESFSDDFFLIHVDNKYLGGPPGANSGKLELIDLDEVNMGILNPNLQFQGLSKSNGVDLWRHHLTGGYIDIVQASLSKEVRDDIFKTAILPLLMYPYNFKPETLPEPVQKLWKDFKKPFHAAKLTVGTTISPSHTKYSIKIFGEKKDTIQIVPRGHGTLEWTYGTPYIVPHEDNIFFEGWKQGAKTKNKLKIVPGADSRHMFRPDFGYLKNDSGEYLCLNGDNRTLYMSKTKPTDMEQVFALTCVRCISHRFSGKTIAPGSPLPSVQVVDKATGDCHFEWGEPLEQKSDFLTKNTWEVTFDGGDVQKMIFTPRNKENSQQQVVLGIGGTVGTWDHLEYNEKRPLLNIENGVFFNGSSDKGAYLSKEGMAWTFESISDDNKHIASVVIDLPDWGGAYLVFSDVNTFTAKATNGTNISGKAKVNGQNVKKEAKVNGQNVKKVSIKGGDSFINVSATVDWVQVDSNGSRRFSFSELFRDEWSVYLRDVGERADGSKYVLRVDLYYKKIFLCNRNGNDVNYGEKKDFIAYITSAS